jgi:hypothetical protein
VWGVLVSVGSRGTEPRWFRPNSQRLILSSLAIRLFPQVTSRSIFCGIFLGPSFLQKVVPYDSYNCTACHPSYVIVPFLSAFSLPSPYWLNLTLLSNILASYMVNSFPCYFPSGFHFYCLQNSFCFARVSAAMTQ